MEEMQVGHGDGREVEDEVGNHFSKIEFIIYLMVVVL